MQYRHGNFTSNDAEFGLRGFSRSYVRTARNTPMYERVVLSTLFEIVADGQQAITDRYNTIYGALKQEGVDSGFLQSNGTQSALWLANSGSRNGVQVVQAPSLEPQNGADYATGHVGGFSVTADYNVNSQSQLLDYSESVTVQGNGGPIEAEIITDVGPVLFVQTALYSPGRIVQQGYAVGLDAWPLANNPIFSDSDDVRLINPAQAITHDAPKRNGQGLQEFRVAWNYQYRTRGQQSALPLIR